MRRWRQSLYSHSDYTEYFNSNTYAHSYRFIDEDTITIGYENGANNTMFRISYPDTEVSGKIAKEVT